jgi:hypothetical protein
VSTIPNTKSTETAIAIMTAPASNVGGADTHADTIHVALITSIGQALADAEFPTTPQGYRDAVVFLTNGAQRLVNQPAGGQRPRRHQDAKPGTATNAGYPEPGL